jgi:hypothetical protein
MPASVVQDRYLLIKGKIVMKESKIELTSRLREEGRWAEASKFKDAVIQRLRSEGVKRQEAGRRGWEEMAAAFPPLPASDTESDESTFGEAIPSAVLDMIECEARKWAQRFDINLSEDAFASLQGEVIAYYWARGLVGDMPGLRVVDGRWERDELEFVRVAEFWDSKEAVAIAHGSQL